MVKKKKINKISKKTSILVLTIFLLLILITSFIIILLTRKPSENRIKFCTEESRNAEVCIEIYQPVCGYFDLKKVNCVTTPCAQTFSNSCFACADENVKYYIPGQCI